MPCADRRRIGRRSAAASVRSGRRMQSRFDRRDIDPEDRDHARSTRCASPAARDGENTALRRRQGTGDNTASRSNGSGGRSRATAAGAASTLDQSSPSPISFRVERPSDRSAGWRPRVEAGDRGAATTFRRPTRGRWRMAAAQYRWRWQGGGASSTIAHPAAGQWKRATDPERRPRIAHGSRWRSALRSQQAVTHRRPAALRDGDVALPIRLPSCFIAASRRPSQFAVATSAMAQRERCKRLRCGTLFRVARGGAGLFGTGCLRAAGPA